MQNSFWYERFCTYTRFEREAQENSEMAYFMKQSVLHTGDWQLITHIAYILFGGKVFNMFVTVAKICLG